MNIPFVDMEKEFVSFLWDRMMEILKEIRVDLKEIRIILNLHTNDRHKSENRSNKAC